MPILEVENRQCLWTMTLMCIFSQKHGVTQTVVLKWEKQILAPVLEMETGIFPVLDNIKSHVKDEFTAGIMRLDGAPWYTVPCVTDNW